MRVDRPKHVEPIRNGDAVHGVYAPASKYERLIEKDYALRNATIFYHSFLPA